MKRLFRLYPLLALLSTMLFFSSCDLLNGASGNMGSKSAALTATPTPTASSTLIPSLPLNCPVVGTARAAVMPRLPSGSRQGILYTASTMSGGDVISTRSRTTSILSRYDMASRQKTDVLKLTIPSQNGQTFPKAMLDAHLSDNGQWIVFKTAVEGKAAVQLVRADGQGLQTLYCTTVEKDLWDTFSFSPDTTYLTFEEAPSSGPSNNQNLMILELATGKLHIAAEVPGPAPTIYEPIKWRDKTGLYVNSSRIGVGMTRDRFQVYLLLDVTQISTFQQISLPTIPGGSGDACYDFDFSPDNTQLLASDCHNKGRGYFGLSTIETLPLTGGNPQIIHTSQHAILYARFITNTTIWFVRGDSSDTGSNGLWKINTDGSGLTRLTTEIPDFETLSYASRTHISSDNTLFAILPLRSMTVVNPPILIGSLNGGNPDTIHPPDQSTSLDLVGWTTF